MPSRYTAEISNEDAIKECLNLGIHYSILDIEPAFKACYISPFDKRLQHY